jgi:hypothetical protein
MLYKCSSQLDARALICPAHLTGSTTTTGTGIGIATATTTANDITTVSTGNETFSSTKSALEAVNLPTCHRGGGGFGHRAPTRNRGERFFLRS